MNGTPSPSFAEWSKTGIPAKAHKQRSTVSSSLTFRPAPVSERIPERKHHLGVTGANRTVESILSDPLKSFVIRPFIFYSPCTLVHVAVWPQIAEVRC